MQPEDREKLILMALPLLMVVIAYGLLVNWRNSSHLAAAEREWAAVEAAQPKPHDLAALQSSLGLLRNETGVLKTKLDDLTNQKTELAQASASSQNQIETVSRLTELVTRRGLKVVDQEIASTSAQTLLPKSLIDARKRISSDTTSSPVVWKVRLIGGYRQIGEVLRDFSDQDLGGVPIGLTMAEAQPEHSVRVWTLTVLL
jgi:hypothetical protein